jgi:hypothetical protein
MLKLGVVVLVVWVDSDGGSRRDAVVRHVMVLDGVMLVVTCDRLGLAFAVALFAALFLAAGILPLGARVQTAFKAR